LELTWTNKDDRLVSREDGSYEWVPPSDYRVAEVHLLHDAAAVGEDSDANLLIRGDALHALASLAELPKYESRYLGRVKLAYLDPPFNTQQVFAQYDDALEHSVWLTMMRDRLLQVKRLLADDGSVWVHCDDSEQARLKVVMDEVFGSDCFVATFIWQKVDSPSENTSAVFTDHDYIVCYSAQPEGQTFKPRSDPSVLDAFKKDEDGKLYRDRLLRKNGKDSLRSDRPGMWFPIKGPDGKNVWPVDDDGIERRWGRSKARVNDALDEIIWKRRKRKGGKEHWVPYVREYARDEPFKPWPTIWSDVLTSRQSKAHLKELLPGTPVFATPKPETLMKRILEIGSSPGDIVLDCFLGSGTTAAVAHKLDRRWVGIEWSKETVAKFVIPRLEKVVAGDDTGGISETADWTGGGGFRVLDVGASMFESDEGEVVLAEWATNGKLAEATAAQLHFTVEDDAPFCGRKGKHRLAVVDGLISASVVELLVSRLDESEELTLCGTSVDPNATDRLKELRPGSRIKKIPASLLADYQQSSRWKPPRLRATSASSSDKQPSRPKAESVA